MNDAGVNPGSDNAKQDAILYNMHSPTQQRGNRAEQRAYRYLRLRGLKLIARQYRCRYGEIDLIMQDKKVTVFIEVRYRQQGEHGSALETITIQKQQKIIQTAQHYLIKHDLFNQVDCRFDSVGIVNQQITWCRDAFDLGALLF